MSTSTPCPEPARLKDLLNGNVTGNEQAELTSHLEACESCQRKLEELVAGHDMWSDARKLAGTAAGRDAPLEHVMKGLKGQGNDATQDAPALEEEAPLNFLSPSDKPGSLGRIGPYEVLKVIGRGGMGIVLKALDPSLQRIVAIKVLAPHLASNGTAPRRFTRKAQAAAAVTHDHVVTIHAVDEANGFPYIVMQFIDGMSLQDRIDKSGPLELKEILRIGMQTASGLAAAHAQGLIHRDIKPANILLENGVQRVKITDFGLARAADDAAGLTQSGMVAGTPQYMAPEQARGEALDHRADLFSLGSVLYTMCAGREPFRASTPLAVLRRVSDDAARPIREVNADIPDWLAAVIAELHAKNPADRYQSAKEVAELLGQRLAQLQQTAWTPPPIPLASRSQDAVGPIELVSDSANPLTTLAICPACACKLHVPDSLVGQTMKCPRCDKPFRVEESAPDNKIVQKPQPRKPAPAKPKRKSMAWMVLLFVGVVLLPVLFCCVPVFGFFTFFVIGRSSRGPAPDVGPTVQPHDRPPSEMTKSATMKSDHYSEWLDALSWFPIDATFCGFINFQRFAPLTLDGDFGQALRKNVGPELAAKLPPEKVGPIRIDRVAFAYVDDTKQPKNSRVFVRITGQMDRKRVSDFLRSELPDARIQEQKGSAGEAVTILDKDRKAPAIALVGETELICAWYVEAQDKKDQPRDEMALIRQMFHVKAKTEPHSRPSDGMEIQEPSILEGALGPNFTTLPPIRPDACALLLGEAPRNLRKALGTPEATFPQLIFLSVCGLDLQRPNPNPIFKLSADLSFENAAESKAFSDMMARWNADSVGNLQKLAPGIKFAPESTDVLRKTFTDMRTDIATGSSSIRPLWNLRPATDIHRIQVEISKDSFAALWEILKQLPWSASSVQVVAPATKQFEGTWQITELQEGGIKRVPAQFAASTWVFDGNKYTFKHGDNLHEGTFKLNPGKDPKWIDTQVTAGKDDGLWTMGIYKFEADDLVLVFASGALFAGSVRERPRDFKVDGTDYTRYVLKRKKS